MNEGLNKEGGDIPQPLDGRKERKKERLRDPLSPCKPAGQILTKVDWLVEALITTTRRNMILQFYSFLFLCFSSPAKHSGG